MRILLLLAVVAFAAHAEEFAKPEEAIKAAKNPSISMEPLYQCFMVIQDLGRPNIGNKGFCAHNWISPAELPQKYQRAYQIFPDRVDVYDLSQVPYKVENGKRVFDLNTTDNFSLEIPSPSDDQSHRFNCSSVSSFDGKSFEHRNPLKTLERPEEFESLKADMRKQLFPSTIREFSREWKISDPSDLTIWGRPQLEKDYKNFFCDCAKVPGVLDPRAVDDLKKTAFTLQLPASEAMLLKDYADSLLSCSELMSQSGEF